MKSFKVIQKERGFTLVELLVVVAIMGLVVVGMHGLFQSTQRSTYQQEEVVEVQQNLRFAMDQIGRDLRMAGFMIPLSLSPIQIAEENSITLNNATLSGRMAKIETGFNSLTNERTIDITEAEMVDLFDKTDNKYVRIIRPANREQPLNAVFTVNDKDRVNKKIILGGFTAAIAFKEGDIIVHVPDTTNTHPRTLSYQVDANKNLIRNAGSSDVVASFIESLQFEYLRENGTAIATLPVPAAELNDIRAVRVTMTAKTDSSKSAVTDGVKSRTLTQVFRIRNQR